MSVAAVDGVVPPAPAAVIGSGIVVRAEGRFTFVKAGRSDTAYQQALDEAFRRGLLEALRSIAPERQSPHDLETWQETILVASRRFRRRLAHPRPGGAGRLHDMSAEVEVYRDKLARAARATGVATAAAAVRVMVLAGSLPMVDRAADEELDAGRSAAVALEAELARRGAIIVRPPTGFPGNSPQARPRRKTVWRWPPLPASSSTPTPC